MSANLYEQDFHEWTVREAEKLRAGRLSELDIEHLIEEMESMGATERREVISRLTVLLMHLLKWQAQPSHRGQSWRLTIEIQRTQVEQVLNQNPSLRPRLPEFMADAYRVAVMKAAKETGMDRRQFPAEPPFSVEQALDQDFWPD
jgi:hypothetical protein